ncbi:MAG TPA: arylamine N-acetyltransferase [Casimicrobiaceae bacterium]|nr:arylamine N-acetyltransferase [Casimicrobiaceae bacterium]
MAFDLDAYLQRIGWNGELRPDRATLGGLLDAHMSRIPFENLDVLLGRGVRLDLESVQHKLVGARRGGYCFEHCTLFAAALEAIGFAPSRHTARVVVVAPRGASPRTHMFLTVPLPEGTFVVDPGFGALAPRVPVPLVEGVQARAGTATHWMARDGNVWALRAKTPDKAVDCWVSAVEDDNLIDFEVGNHFTATHPSSHFVNRLMLRALTDDGQVSVMNRDVTIRRGAESQALQLPDRAALRTLLAEHFGFDLPEVEGIRVPTIDEWR